MSVQTLYTAATGMQALEAKLDVIANNLANVNTTAFKRNRANFEDLFYRNEVLPGADVSGGNAAVGTQTGLGTRISSIQTNFQQGAYQQTNGELDLSIAGEGFFIVQDPNTGNEMYTRAGNFAKNSSGQIVLASAGTGYELSPSITIPPDTTDVVITPDGQVMVQQPGSTTPQSVGQIQVAMFQNPEGLLKLGENLYQQTGASSSPTQTTPGLDGAGGLRQRYLEASNVEPVQELIDLITTQRSFEINSQAVQAGDEMLQLIANLPRS